ncbi:MAG: 6-carboxytetrahydropterin synthase QueD [Chthonomonadales bacterium]
MYTLIVRASFEAAHDIPGHKGKCARLHGHSYKVEAEFSGHTLDSIGMLCDFTDLKTALNEFLPDHTYLNDLMPFSTTAENVAAWIFEQLAARDLPVSAVTLWETEKNGCRYIPG